MSALQWSLLILSVIVVAALVAVNFREKRGARQRRESQERPARTAPGEPTAASVEQMDIFEREEPAPFLSPAPPEPAEEIEEEAEPAPRRATARPEAATQPSRPLVDGAHQFDEFGVGRPRRRQAPTLGGTLSAPPVEPAAAPSPSFLRPSAPAAAPVSEAPRPPAHSATKPEGQAEPGPAPRLPAMPEKIISLLIAEREGAPILGPKLHRALSAQGLVFGQRQIYHRMSGERVVYSVASLVKPGVLVPEDAERFSTPGLSMFLVLPGPTRPVLALQDMLDTAQALGRALNAEIYDGRKLPLSPDSIRAMLQEVEDWSRQASA